MDAQLTLHLADDVNNRYNTYYYGLTRKETRKISS